MRGFYAGLVASRLGIAAAAAIGGWASMAPVSAAPPTVTPSPGYDARLQEQRGAQPSYAPVSEPVVRYPRPLPRHRARRVHGGAHW